MAIKTKEQLKNEFKNGDVIREQNFVDLIDSTYNDIVENEERNKKYTKLTTEQELIAKYYEKSNDIEDFVTASDILVTLSSLNLRLNHINLGRALSGFNFQKVKHPKRQVYGYLAKSLFKDSPWEMELSKKNK